MIALAGPPPFIFAFMLVVSLVFLCLGAFYLSPWGSAWGRSQAEKRHARRLATGLGPLTWIHGREAQLTRFLGLVWVIAGSVIALACVLVLTLG
ncbi:hypothetical protein [Streptomyces sp. NBC_01800]|uniref:hypothetical protein n=1 Tax=Streptomyces sp. NBC_01800 TaxID=2975945 RepID=UPI002DD995C1|nr:hypothetical protein [Streptomyces sp. NBC_01800]WSA68766.1 hypothetical protein OIE65_18255 [Streptomyces sp. NBC_01800]